ncbi:MAG TPA: hypothetical protein VKT83_16555 [bacterium]|nr:hypothetical protein [bacterium]
MKSRWFVALIVGVLLLLAKVGPTFAGFEGGDPGQGNHNGQENPNNNHVDPDHGPKP